MDIVNITLWSETAAFPLLTTLTLVPLIAMMIILLLPSPVLALRAGFVGALLTLLLSIYLLFVFDADSPGIQLYEQFQSIADPKTRLILAMGGICVLQMLISWREVQKDRELILPH